MSTTAELRRRPYVPQGAIVDLWRAKERRILVDGPVRTGKTQGALEYLLAGALKYPRSRQLILRRYDVDLAETTLQVLEDYVLPEAWRPKSARRTRSKYEFPNGSEIMVGGMNRPQGYMGGEFNRILVDEAIEAEKGAAEYLETRLTHHAVDPETGAVMAPKMVYLTNPGPRAHWLWRAHEEGKIRRIASTHRDNPRWWDAARGAWTPEGKELWDALSNGLTGYRRMRMRDGLWVAAEGMVYDEWAEDRHVIERMPHGWEKWPRARAVDFGYNDPFICLWAAVSPTRDIYVYREYVRCCLTVEEHVPQLRRLQSPQENLEHAFDFTVADHDAEDRATLALHGIDTEPCTKPRAGVRDRTAWPAAFEPVKKRLREGRLFVLRSALQDGGGRETALTEKGKPCGILEEITSYQWAKSDPGKPTREFPEGGNDHSLDALRYLVHRVDEDPSMGKLAPKKGPPVAEAPVYEPEDGDEDGGWQTDLG